MSVDEMDVFLHYSIRHILGAKWSQMMDKHISNKQIRNRFYNIQDIRKMIATRQLQFVGKVMRREDEFLPKQLMIGWVNNKRPIGRPTTTIKTSICQEPETTLSSKYYFYSDIIGTQIAKPGIYMDRFGLLKYWINDPTDGKILT